MPFSLPKRVLSTQSCCRPWFQTERILNPDDPTPPDPSSLWYAEIPGLLWNGTPTIFINGIPTDILLNGDGLKNTMQGLFGGNTSGGWYMFGTNGVTLFIYQQADPTAEVTVELEGGPVELTWTQGTQDLVSSCYQVVVAIDDTPADNVIQLITVEGGSLEFFATGTSLDVLISTPDALDNLIRQSFGDSATLVVTDLGGGDIQFQILNTLVEPGSIVVYNLNTTNTDTEPFVEIACP